MFSSPIESGSHPNSTIDTAPLRAFDAAPHSIQHRSKLGTNAVGAYGTADYAAARPTPRCPPYQRAEPAARCHRACTSNNIGPTHPALTTADRKSTRLNSSHVAISYAV